MARSKTFNWANGHPIRQKLGEHQLSRFEENGKRKYLYLDPDPIFKDKSAYSITTILDSFPNPALEAWEKAVGAKEAERTRGIAARQGTALHLAIEAYLKNDEFFPQEASMPNIIDLFRRCQPVLDEIEVIYAVECPLFGYVTAPRKPRRYIAGTCDFIGYIYGRRSIIDFKNSSKPKTEDMILNYFLQETAYADMVWCMSEHPIDQIVTIVACEEEPQAQVFVKDVRDYRPLLVDKVEQFYHNIEMTG